MNEYPNIKKQDGTLEPFDPDKLRDSLRRSGADPKTFNEIADKMSGEVREGDTTGKIYRRAFSLLKQKREPIPAARYSMKRAIRELGPSGFPFEDFVAEIWRAHGYTVETGVILQGTCAEHEVDMLAKQDGKTIGAEIKFHNNLGLTSDLKIALYVDARFADLKERGVEEGWLITNTRFTENAEAYGRCRNLNMVSWNYPKGNTLQDMIEKAGVQPITALTTLSKHEKTELLKEGLALCRVLNDRRDVLAELIPASKLEEVLAEGRALCSSGRGL